MYKCTYICMCICTLGQNIQGHSCKKRFQDVAESMPWSDCMQCACLHGQEGAGLQSPYIFLFQRYCQTLFVRDDFALTSLQSCIPVMTATIKYLYIKIMNRVHLQIISGRICIENYHLLKLSSIIKKTQTVTH